MEELTIKHVNQRLCVIIYAFKSGVRIREKKTPFFQVHGFEITDTLIKTRKFEPDLLRELNVLRLLDSLSLTIVFLNIGEKIFRDSQF